MPRGGKRPGAGRPSTDRVAANADPKAFCDRAIEAGAESMQAAGAPVAMILDRLLTYAAAQACAQDGSAFTARQFRAMADRIEGGVFHRVTGEGAQKH